jgi:hypothetical protein
VRRQVVVARAVDGDAVVYRLSRRATPQPAVRAETALRRWRDSAVVGELDGEARVASRSGALLSFKLEAKLTAQRNETPIAAEIAVTARLDDVGRTAAIAAPVAEDLRLRQRTILDERALLGDLTSKRKEGSR